MSAPEENGAPEHPLPLPAPSRRKDDLHTRIEALNRRPLPPVPTQSSDAPVEDLRRRLKRENRALSPEAPPARSALEPIVFRRDVPRREAPATPPVLLHGRPVRLEDAVPGREARASDGSRFYLIEERLAESAPGRDPSAGLAAAFARPELGLRARLEHLLPGAAFECSDVVLLDLETTGLSATSPLFLIGTLVWDGPGLVLRQYFARDYSEERAALAEFLEQNAGRRLLVSFNGKSFDLPFVRLRAGVHNLPFTFEASHLDMLHVARRAWRGRVPDCRLQTLELHLCQRARRGDIPGALIPEAYHTYVRSGNAAQMVEVLRHNRQDLLTLAELMAQMPAPAAPERKPGRTRRPSRGPLWE